LTRSREKGVEISKKTFWLCAITIQSIKQVKKRHSIKGRYAGRLECVRNSFKTVQAILKKRNEKSRTTEKNSVQGSLREKVVRLGG